MAGRRTNQYVASLEASTGGEEVANFLGALRRYEWHQDAACAASEVNFFPDEFGVARGNVASPALLIPILVCERCPVLTRCLEAGFETWTFSHTMSRESPNKQKTRPQADAIVQASNWGVWGGSTQHERHALRHLPAAEAVATLESTFDQRLQGRIKAWRKWVLARQAGGGGHGRYDKRLAKMLAARESSVGRFHWEGQGGPGRGHKGPVAILATEQCSRDTAWRRLHAAA
jgi:hypothetical protein